MLGLYVSDHPLLGIEHVLAAAADCSLASLTGEERRGRSDRDRRRHPVHGHPQDDQTRRLPGRPRRSRTSRASVEVLFFPAAYQVCGVHLAEDAVLLIRARLDKREDVPRLIAMEVSVPDVSPRGRVAR